MSRRLVRSICRWAICGGATLVVGLIIQQSDAFTNCIRAHKNTKEYQALHPGRSVVDSSAIRTRLRLNYVCAWEFTDKNNGAIIALATIALSAFTATLWQATRGLQELGRLQQTDMQTSQAEAMAGVCAAAEAQERVLQQQSAATDAVARAAQESAEIARRALTELERPFAFVEVTQSGIGPGPLCRFTISLTGEQFRFRVVNHGRTPAFLIDRLTFWPIEAGMTARPYPIDPKTQPGNTFPSGCTSSGDSPYEEIVHLFKVCDAQRLLEEADWYKNRMFFIGYIRYSDIFCNRCISGFCFVYDTLGECFVRFGGDAYNYTITDKDAI
jgi:hypothetical protein